jgi:hypothetical protein
MTRIEPIHTHHGSGPRRAAVLSPVLPLWEDGRFFAPLVQPLVSAGYSVSIFDTLSLLPAQPPSLETFAESWSTYLRTVGQIDLLAGCALGGAVVQAMLGEPWAARVPKVLLISAPSVADATLNTRLGTLARLARGADVISTLELLDRLVAPEGTPVASTSYSLSPATLPVQAARLAHGFALLQDIDVGAIVARYTGRLLNVYGDRSQLVRRQNIRVGPSSIHSACAIPNGGMRPLSDDLARVLNAMREHLDIDVPVIA